MNDFLSPYLVVEQERICTASVNSTRQAAAQASLSERADGSIFLPRCNQDAASALSHYCIFRSPTGPSLSVMRPQIIQR